MDIEFEWDNIKNDDNIDKHGVSFEEARDIWLRPNALFIREDDRDYNEDRYVAMGTLPNSTVLVVVFTDRGERIRIISAREAESKERKQYYEKIYRAKR